MAIKSSTFVSTSFCDPIQMVWVLIHEQSVEIIQDNIYVHKNTVPLLTCPFTEWSGGK